VAFLIIYKAQRRLALRHGAGQSEGPKPRTVGVVGALQVCFPWCARSTEGIHARTARGSAQRFQGAKAKAALHEDMREERGQ
jgi:hypothetical protein